MRARFCKANRVSSKEQKKNLISMHCCLLFVVYFVFDELGVIVLEFRLYM